MKKIISIMLLLSPAFALSQVWKVLPKGVRIIGYRNVTTSKIDSNFSPIGDKSSLGTQFKLDASLFNELAGNIITPGSDVDSEAYNNLKVGEYAIDASAKVKAHGTGFGLGITDKVMFYAQVAYYEVDVKSKIKRTSGNTYEETARILEENGGTQNMLIAENLRHMIDADEGTIQSVITNHYNYRPLGDWYGKGYGDLETGLMINVADEGSTGLMIYPGVVIPTGFQDDPDILQDIAFGDGQFDFFTEIATGYNFNKHLLLGTTLRYTYQAESTKRMRIPSDSGFTLSDQIDDVRFKLGNRIDWMMNTTISFNDWLSLTPSYRFMYQEKSRFYTDSNLSNQNLAYNSDRLEHLGQITTTLSSIAPFLNKTFPLPAQLNFTYAKTLSGKNVPVASRVEFEIRMLF